MDIQIISNLMKNHWDHQIPVNIKSIAKSMNIELIPMTFEESYQSKIKTKIINIENNYQVHYNTKRGKHFQDIIIAHALARIALNQVHKNETIEDAENFDLIKYKNSEDLDANIATYQIIIPTKELKHAVKHYSTWDPDEIANIFDTNIELAYQRMKSLGIVDA